MQTSNLSKLQMRDHKLLQVGLMISLAIHVGLFTGYKRFVREARIHVPILGDIEAVYIPPTVQKKKIIEPAKPFVPIPQTDTEPLEEELGTWDHTIVLSNIPPIPKFKEDETEPFIVFDKPPQPVGGYAAIVKNVVYPKMAITVGIEGTTVVQAIIDKYGNVISTEVIQSVGFESCDQAAADAIRKTKWIPAQQRDQPVKVKIAIPVDFKIKS